MQVEEHMVIPSRSRMVQDLLMHGEGFGLLHLEQVNDVHALGIVLYRGSRLLALLEVDGTRSWPYKIFILLRRKEFTARVRSAAARHLHPDRVEQFIEDALRIYDELKPSEPF